MVGSDRLGLTLTRCDCCGRRQFCAVNGAALCATCCPGAVEAARGEAQEALRAARVAAQQALVEAELLPGECEGPPVPFREVAHLFRW